MVILGIRAKLGSHTDLHHNEKSQNSDRNGPRRREAGKRTLGGLQ